MIYQISLPIYVLYLFTTMLAFFKTVEFSNKSFIIAYQMESKASQTLLKAFVNNKSLNNFKYFLVS